jgi:hypothetical protein
LTELKIDLEFKGILLMIEAAAETADLPSLLGFEVSLIF